MVSIPSEFVTTPQHKGVALYAYSPADEAFITLPLADATGTRKNYDIASECLDAADYIKYGQDASRTSYTRRQPTANRSGYSGFKSDKVEAEIALADTFAALYETASSMGARIIGKMGYSFEVVRGGRVVVTYIVSHTVGKDASEFRKYVIPWSSMSKEMTETISINPHTQEVMLTGKDVRKSEVLPLTEWDEFVLDGHSVKPPKNEPERAEDELDVLLRRKSRGEVLSSADFHRMVHLRQKRAWEESPMYAKTKDNPLIQRLAVPNRAVIDGEVVDYDRGVLDHPEAWHTHILDYIMSMENGDWFTVDDIDEVVRNAGIKMGRSVRTQFMSMTAYLLKLTAEGVIAVRGIEGLDVFTSKRDTKTTPLVSVDSFTVVGVFKPVQTDIFDLLHHPATV
jgi:hypothetical protein